jgi:hypothetical protein
MSVGTKNGLVLQAKKKSENGGRDKGTKFTYLEPN